MTQSAPEPLTPWERVEAALTLLAVDPVGLKGLWLRARASGLRDRITAALHALPLPVRRIHPTIGDDALFGGLDLAATLASGTPVIQKGVLDEPAALVLAMAERALPGLAARLGTALDVPRHCLIALDEGAERDELLPSGLVDRLGLFLDLDGLPWGDTREIHIDPERLAAARARLATVTTPAKAGETLARVAAQLGIASLRAPLLALAAARAQAAWEGHPTVTEDDLRRGADLVFAHRALPATEEAPPEPEPPQDEPEDDTPPPPEQEQQQGEELFPEEMLVEAVRAALPSDLLEQLAAGRAARMARGASGTGSAKTGNRRGRPLPSRQGRLGTGARIDLVGTLRAAAPWQPLRRRQQKSDAVLLVRSSDIRIKRFKETSDRVLIFAVDASGSSAMARLSEAKGAVELLLGQAYARRDHVSLVAFRGRDAELMLPPTRSLVQTKRRLAGLPGGGGTPLAHGLRLALAVGAQARSRGMTPTIALLTDGRGNIALDGSANRAQAEEDALKLATTIRASGLPSIVIDTANRPQPSLQTLAKALDAPYIALPRADAHRLSSVLGAAMGD
ncbi:magnesium chelatase subunit D [Cereibacter sphaeroides]|uniref:magnesium chelatase subunit D n=1 Tax=Cereibacter sphaeroides TaxID=1063 RepID=UPI001F2D359F|nr:magnesium chelatase subunit D [Cereibacter sphaeroides]MCE6960425.1 magnesium chelatase subunit D [Cereibacter sphaeroides]MCE6969375.1 magnesium chelatase subunit D [Cereibacter sphaeroides]MCE6975433.1 magnesium chelatase subunit D [Cereibacter sphaeroides]